jgi:hypothetical protein
VRLRLDRQAAVFGLNADGGAVTQTGLFQQGLRQGNNDGAADFAADCGAHEALQNWR